MTLNSAPDANGAWQDQLDAAKLGANGGARIARSASRAGRRYALTIAALIAAYLLAVVYLYPLEDVWVNIVTTAAFAIPMVAASLWYGRQRAASSRGWTRRYSVGLAFTMGLFGLGIAISVTTDSQALWLWLPYALLTAVPVVVASSMRGAR